MTTVSTTEGIGPRSARTLEKAGIRTVEELRRRNAANLTAAIEQADNRERIELVDPTPSQTVVQTWVDGARDLAPVVTH